MPKSNFAKIFVCFLIWRILLFAVAYISPAIIPDFGARFPYYQERLIGTGLPHFIWSWGNFDGVHYLGIAKDGYAYQFTQTFFPLYPILTKLLTFFTGSLLISGLLISNAAFLAGLLVFFKLVKSKFDEKTALWSAGFILAFPTSFYFGAIYTEGIFFLMTVSFFYLLEKNKSLAASIVGAFASATRLVGLFLTAAIFSKPRLTLLLIPLGFLSYVLYLQLEFQNPLYFLTAQSIFGQERETTQIVLLPQVLWRYLKILLTTGGLSFANAAFELTSTVFAAAMLYLAWTKKYKLDWIVFSALATLVPTLTGTLASMPRYILVVFPIYIVLAQIKSTLIKISAIIVFSTALFWATVLFTQGYWVA